MSGCLTSINRTIFQLLFYWGLFGGVVGYYVYHPDYEPMIFEDWDSATGVIFTCIILILWFGFEVMNLMCHIHFASR